MGICSKAKDIICCNKVTDVPIFPEMIYQNNENNEQKKSNINNTTNINQSVKETAQKSWGIGKEDEKIQEMSDIKQLTEIKNSPTTSKI